MAIGFNKKAKGAEDMGNIFWTTMSDLMLGLAVIFMMLFVLTMTGYSQETVQQMKEQAEVSQELVGKFKEANIDAYVDEMTGDIKISDLELFEINSWNLSPKGKAYLDKLVPIYIDTIFSKKKFADGIENVKVQGHTDSQSFAGAFSKEQQYTRNMELSLKRANAVAEYMFHTKFDRAYSNSLQKKLIVEGKSFSEPVLVNGVEDYAKSRRVELKLDVKHYNMANAMGLFMPWVKR